MPTILAQREYTDPEQLSAALPAGSGRYKVIGRGAFRAELSIVELGRVTLQCARESLARIAHHAMRPDKLGILGWLRGGPLPVVGGVEIRPGDLISIGGGTASYHRTSASVDYVALILDSADLSRVAVDLAGRDLPLENGLACLPSSPATARVVALIESARAVARESPQVFASAEAAHALDQSLLHAVIASVAARTQRMGPVVDFRRARIMKRFEAVVEANAARPLHVPELCRLVGVAERTLRKCTQQHLGMSPHQYLLLRRIHLARRALLRGDPSGATVTRIATNHGFWELGRFAAVYRSLFGESPSATLRRQQAEFA